jgi:chromosome segregation ATPase
MFRIATGATLCLVLTAAAGFSQTRDQIKAQIKQVRAQIKALDNQERQTIRQKDAKYNAEIRKLGRPDNQLKAERARLAQSEKDALALEKDPAVQAKIKADFDQKRAQLLTKIKGLNAKINALKKQRAATNAPIKKQYHQQRHALRAQLEQLEAALKKTKKK